MAREAVGPVDRGVPPVCPDAVGEHVADTYGEVQRVDGLAETALVLSSRLERRGLDHLVINWVIGPASANRGPGQRTPFGAPMLFAGWSTEPGRLLRQAGRSG